MRSARCRSARPVEPTQGHHAAIEVPAQPAAQLIELGARRVGRRHEDQRQRHVVQVPQQRAERERGIRVQPLGVVDREHDGLLRRGRVHRLHQRPPEWCGHRRARAREPIRPLRQQAREGRERGGRRPADAGRVDQAATREREHAAPRIAPVALDRPCRRHRRAVEPEAREHLLEQPRLPDARLPFQQDQHRTARTGGAGRLLEQPPELAGAAAERRAHEEVVHPVRRDVATDSPLAADALDQRPGVLARA